MIPPEIADALAEFENRLAYLEALHTWADGSYGESEPTPQPKKETVSNKGNIDELKGLVLFLQRKLNEHIDAPKKKQALIKKTKKFD